MPVKIQQVAFGRRVTIFYCRSCEAIFGKTISVMIGEAVVAGRWYGSPSAIFIDWLLREPCHCANQLVYYRRARRLDSSPRARHGGNEG